MPPGENALVLGEDHGVVGNGVGLGQQDFGGMANLREARAHHLRLAAERIRILHALAADVRLADFALFAQQMAVSLGGGDLARLTANRLQAGVEGHAAGQGGLDRERAGHRGRGIQVFGRQQSVQRQRG